MPEERLPRLTPPDLDDAQQELYDVFVGGLRQTQASFFPVADGDGVLSGPYRAMLLSPPLGRHVERLGRAVRYESVLPERTRELAILTVAHLSGSRVEWRAHEALALACGVPAETVRTLRGPEPVFAADTDEITHRLISQLLVEHEVSDDVFERVRSWLGLDGVFELIATVGYYQLIAHINVGFAVGEDGPRTTATVPAADPGVEETA
jgi:4-carboxymuconolactone decarboxylase